MAFEFLQAALDQRAADSLLRKRVEISNNSQAIIEVEGKHYINFSSNDYLGLSQHQDVLQSFAEGLSLYGASSSASSVVTGYSKEHRLLEDDICEHTGQASALLFSSGFAANQAICQAVFQTDIGKLTATQAMDDKQILHATTQRHIVADKFMHASFIESAMQLKAAAALPSKNTVSTHHATELNHPENTMPLNTSSLSRFKHNDLGHLQSKLNSSGDTLVVTEGIFSMDGDRGNIAGIQNVINETNPNAWLMVDDAHAIGCIGEDGMGSSRLSKQQTSKQQLSKNNGGIDILMGTFGKAIGTQGAFVAGSSSLVEFLVNFAKHYVYSTAIPAAQARATRTSMQIMRQGAERELLQRNIELFKSLAAKNQLPILNVDGPIQPLILGEPEKAMKLSQQLKQLGIWVNAIRSPTVPRHSDRLRITISALHQPQDIQALVDALVLCMPTIVNDNLGTEL